MNMNIYTKKGSMVVEASLCIPILITAVVAISLLMRVVVIEEKISFLAMDKGRALAMRAYNIEYDYLFPLTLCEDIKELMPKAENVKVNRYRYLYEDKGIDKLIMFNISYNFAPPLPFFKINERADISLVVRGFCGKDNSKVASYEVLEEEEESQLVWIFPNYGEKYHDKNCIVVSPYPNKVIMKNSVRITNKECKLCDSSKLKNGDIAYVFSTSSAYHTGKCKSVDKCVISMEKEDAKARGYTACLKCGGGI